MSKTKDYYWTEAENAMDTAIAKVALGDNIELVVNKLKDKNELQKLYFKYSILVVNEQKRLAEHGPGDVIRNLTNEERAPLRANLAKRLHPTELESDLLG